MQKEIDEIVKDHQNGDPNALLDLMNNKYVISIINAAFKQIASEGILDREEFFNEIYILLYTRLKKFIPQSPRQTTSYLDTTIKYKALDILDKNNKEHNKATKYNNAHSIEDLLTEDTHNLSPIVDYVNKNKVLRMRLVDNVYIKDIAVVLGLSKTSTHRLIETEMSKLKLFAMENM